jgi:hypothetical protein
MPALLALVEARIAKVSDLFNTSMFAEFAPLPRQNRM